MEISEYKELLLKYYTENHSFIEKAVFTVTAGAITFLLGYSENITEKYFVGYAIMGKEAIFTLHSFSGPISNVLTGTGQSVKKS